MPPAKSAGRPRGDQLRSDRVVRLCALTDTPADGPRECLRLPAHRSPEHVHRPPRPT